MRRTRPYNTHSRAKPAMAMSAIAVLREQLSHLQFHNVRGFGPVCLFEVYRLNSQQLQDDRIRPPSLLSLRLTTTELNIHNEKKFIIYNWSVLKRR